MLAGPSPSVTGATHQKRTSITRATRYSPATNAQSMVRRRLTRTMLVLQRGQRSCSATGKPQCEQCRSMDASPGYDLVEDGGGAEGSVIFTT
jgi:hypothetical protein